MVTNSVGGGGHEARRKKKKLWRWLFDIDSNLVDLYMGWMAKLSESILLLPVINGNIFCTFHNIMSAFLKPQDWIYFLSHRIVPVS